MDRETFIEQIASYVCKYAPLYNIKACSAVIGQACLESGYGTSSKAKYHNYFGLKYRTNRCPTASGVFKDGGSEQKLDGTYVPIMDDWFAFPNMEAGVQGYFDFINISNYSNVKGVSDPWEYLTLLKQDHYATSLNYVDKVMKVVYDNNLKRFDSSNTGGSKMKIAINAGHAAPGGGAIGAIGLISESVEDRIVKDKVVELLRAQNYEVVDCTVDKGTQAGVLNGIISKTNAANADLNVSIHFNSGANRLLKDGKTTGTEVFIYSPTTKCKGTAQQIVDSIAQLGFKNRGVKSSKSLAFLSRTKTESLLIECCFVDDGDDIALYNADAMAQAIVRGITGKPVEVSNTPVVAVSAQPATFRIRTKYDMNIRKTPSASGQLTGSIAKKNNVFTIVDVQGSWGKLKSGLGWINISTTYVTYV